MSEIPNPSHPSDDLQFDVVEPTRAVSSQSAGLTCSFCKRPIELVYYALRDNMICLQCRDHLLGPPAKGGFTRFLTASTFGIAAAAISAIIWYAIRVATNSELGIVAVAVGFAVGKAVRKGSGNWGGPGYQFLAVLLTYLSIGATYVPSAVQAFAKGFNSPRAKAAAVNRDATNPEPKARAHEASRDQFDNADKPARSTPVIEPIAKIVIVFGIGTCLALTVGPIAMGWQSPILLLIYGIALFEAWKFTKRLVLPIQGPYQLAARTV
jgi:hypothetical protein